MRVKALLLAFIVPFATSALAQEETNDDVNIFDSINIELVDLQALGEQVNERLVGEELRLSLEDCIAMAMANNPDIQIIEFETAVANADLMAAMGEFDPVLSGAIRHVDNTSPPSPTEAAFGGFTENISTKVSAYQLSLGGKLPWWGTQYDVSYDLGRETGTFTLNPLTGQRLSIYDGGLTTTITQPILRGRGTKLNKVRITSAKIGQDISRAQIETTALNSIGSTIKAYWDLVGAIQNLAVRRQSLDNAMRLVEINEQRLRIGTAAAIEVLQAKAGAATRQSELITARTNILNAEDVLKNLIGLQDGEVFSPRSIVPTTSPGAVGFEWNLDKSINTALANRPEIRTAALQVENAELETFRTKNDKLPQIDAQVSYNQNAREIELDDINQGIREKQGRNWTIGITGSIPILNRAARGAHIRARQVEQQQERRLEKAKQDVMFEVRNAIRGVVTSELLVETNLQARILQEANVAAEEKRLKLGVTTSQDVLDRQQDLTEAQTQELQAIVDYEKALIDLQVAEGILLQEMNINWDSDLGVD